MNLIMLITNSIKGKKGIHMYSDKSKMEKEIQNNLADWVERYLNSTNQHGNDYISEKMYNALKIFLLDDKTKTWLEKNNPSALRQAMDAIMHYVKSLGDSDFAELVNNAVGRSTCDGKWPTIDDDTTIDYEVCWGKDGAICLPNDENKESQFRVEIKITKI